VAVGDPVYWPVVTYTKGATVEQQILRAMRTAGEQGLTKREAYRASHGERWDMGLWGRAWAGLIAGGHLVPLESSALQGGNRGVKYRVGDAL
jgi:hypothetical protein